MFQRDVTFGRSDFHFSKLGDGQLWSPKNFCFGRFWVFRLVSFSVSKVVSCSSMSPAVQNLRRQLESYFWPSLYFVKNFATNT